MKIRKEKPTCQLDGLVGIKKQKVDAYWIHDVSDIEPTLELGCACTAADDNGAINVWKTDNGDIKGELMRFCSSVEKRTFPNYMKAEECVKEWLERIK